MKAHSAAVNEVQKRILLVEYYEEAALGFGYFMGYYQPDKKTNTVPILSKATLSRPLESSHDKNTAGDLFSALRERGVGRQTGAEPSLLDTTVKRDLGIIAGLAAERKRMLAQLS